MHKISKLLMITAIVSMVIILNKSAYAHTNKFSGVKSSPALLKVAYSRVGYNKGNGHKKRHGKIAYSSQRGGQHSTRSKSKNKAHRHEHARKHNKRHSHHETERHHASRHGNHHNRKRHRHGRNYWRDYHRGHRLGYHHHYHNGWNYYYNRSGFFFPEYGFIEHGHRHSRYCPNWHFEAFVTSIILGAILAR